MIPTLGKIKKSLKETLNIFARGDGEKAGQTTSGINLIHGLTPTKLVKGYLTSSTWAMDMKNNNLRCVF